MGAIGGFGKIRVANDFLGTYNAVAWGTGTLVAGDGLGQFGFTSVNEGSFASTVDEPGGVLAVTTDTGDNDNAALMAGLFKPADGGMFTEWRYKIGSATLDAVFCGFTETLSLTTPVMPLEFATATMTYNGTGGIVGIVHDPDATTNDFRAAMGDGGAAISDSGTTGVTSSSTIAADAWYVTRVIVHPDGEAEVWHGGGSDAQTDNFRLVKHFKTGTLLTNTDVFYACLMIENRSAAASVLEIDYGIAEGGRDWTA